MKIVLFFMLAIKKVDEKTRSKVGIMSITSCGKNIDEALKRSYNSNRKNYF